MKLNQLTRIVEEDFPQESRDVIQKLARALNPFLEQIGQVMSKNIDYDNLNRELLTYTVTVDSSGKPIDSTELKHNLKTKPKGFNCISARNLKGTSEIPSGTPFITFSYTGDNFSILKITGVSGLPPNVKFELLLEIIG